MKLRNEKKLFSYHIDRKKDSITVKLSLATVRSIIIKSVEEDVLRTMGRWQTGLSAREEQVLDSVKAGKGNKEIANELHLAIRTVKFHVSALLRKYNVDNRRALMVIPKGPLPTFKKKFEDIEGRLG